jgi:hypothetical protein
VGQNLELGSVGKRGPAGNGMSVEAEESPRLEAVIRKRLVESGNTENTGVCVFGWVCVCV